MIEFIAGIVFACFLIVGFAVIDVKIFKDKAINIKVGWFKSYLYFTATEIGVFVLGFLTGRFG